MTQHHLIAILSLCLPATLFGQAFWTPLFPNPPQSGFWDDPANWNGGHVPQAGDAVEIAGIGGVVPSSVTITYRNSYDPTAVFQSLLFGTATGDLTFILHDDVSFSSSVAVDHKADFDHSAGTLRSSGVLVSGDALTSQVNTYHLYGTASLTDITGNGPVLGGLDMNIGSNGQFQMDGGALAAGRLQVTGQGGIPPLYRQTGGSADFHQIYLEGFEDSVFRISGGIANVYGDMYLGSNVEYSGSTPPVVGAVAELEVSGLGTLDLFHPNQSLLAGLIIGDDFPATVNQSGSSHIEVGHILYVGYKSTGTYTLDGGTLDASYVKVGNHLFQPVMNASGEFIQNGGTVTLASNASFFGDLEVGDTGAPGMYRLNNGLLSTETTTVNDAFVHTNGTHQCSVNLAVGGNYIFTAGVIDTAQLTVNSGVLHYNGGTLTDRSFNLWDGTLNQAAGLHHQTDGDALIRYPGSTINMGAGASHTITGRLSLYDTSFTHDSGAISCGTLFTALADPVVLDQNGGNLTILGTADFNAPTVWMLRSGVVVHGGAFTLTNDSSFQQSGGTYTGRGFALSRDSSFSLSGGTTQFSEDGAASGSITVQPGADFSARDLVIGDDFAAPAAFAQSGGAVNLATLTCKSGSSFQRTGGSFVTTGNATITQAATAPIGLHASTTSIGGTLDYRGLGNLGGGNALFLVDGAAALTVGGNFLVGTSGAVSQSGTSSITITGAHVLAGESGANVYEEVANGSSLASASAEIGGLGRGQMQMSGQHTVTGLLEVGSSAALDSRYTLSGSGNLQAGSVHVASRAGGGGRMDFNGGVNAIATSLKVADAPGAAGELRLTAGSLNAGSLTVGGSGTGLVTHTNGNINCTGVLTLRSGSSYSFAAGQITASELAPGGSFEIPASGASTPRIRGPVNNTGSLTFKRTAITDVSSLAHTNSGTIDLQSSAEWQFSAGNSLTNLPAGNISGVGKLGGGTFQLVNQGTLSPGGLFGWGALTIDGNLTHAPGALLQMKISGTTIASYDRILISSGGSASLTGNLRVSFSNLFTPAAGQSFQLISGSNVSANFANIEIVALPPTLGYTITSTASSFTLNLVNAPNIPSAVTASAGSDSSINVDWTDTNSGTTSHRIRVATNPAGPWSDAGTTSPGTITYSAGGLLTGTAYWFQVQAFDGTNTSQWSAAATASTWTALEAWRFLHFGTTANTGIAADDEDPMGDGIPNLIKYTLGMVPLSDSHGHPNLPRLVFVDVAGSAFQHPGLEFRTPDPLPAGLTVDVLVSDNLVNWLDTPVLHQSDVPQAGISRHVWRTLEMVTETPARFLKLRAQRTTP